MFSRGRNSLKSERSQLFTYCVRKLLIYAAVLPSVNAAGWLKSLVSKYLFKRLCMSPVNATEQDAIEGIQELRPKLYVNVFARQEFLEKREIPVIHILCAQIADICGRVAECKCGRIYRSEEHTSELQSHSFISYA